jgi:membrane fusion protein (multidrug efflux system)
MQGRLLRLVLLVGVPTLALLVAIGFWLTGGRYITTENAYVRADIVQIAPEVAGRITEVLVRDHARVAAGAVLLRLDPAPFRLGQLGARLGLTTRIGGASQSGEVRCRAFAPS